MPRWKELKRFCEHDGWELYKDTDHYFYQKVDDDGNIRLDFLSISKWTYTLSHFCGAKTIVCT